MILTSDNETITNDFSSETKDSFISYKNIIFNLLSDSSYLGERVNKFPFTNVDVSKNFPVIGTNTSGGNHSYYVYLPNDLEIFRNKIEEIETLTFDESLNVAQNFEKLFEIIDGFLDLHKNLNSILEEHNIPFFIKDEQWTIWIKSMKKMFRNLTEIRNYNDNYLNNLDLKLKFLDPWISNYKIIWLKKIFGELSKPKNERLSNIYNFSIIDFLDLPTRKSDFYSDGKIREDIVKINELIGLTPNNSWLLSGSASESYYNKTAYENFTGGNVFYQILRSSTFNDGKGAILSLLEYILSNNESLLSPDEENNPVFEELKWLVDKSYSKPDFIDAENYSFKDVSALYLKLLIELVKKDLVKYSEKNQDQIVENYLKEYKSNFEFYEENSVLLDSAIQEAKNYKNSTFSEIQKEKYSVFSNFWNSNIGGSVLKTPFKFLKSVERDDLLNYLNKLIEKINNDVSENNLDELRSVERKIYKAIFVANFREKILLYTIQNLLGYGKDSYRNSIHNLNKSQMRDLIQTILNVPIPAINYDNFENDIDNKTVNNLSGSLAKYLFRYVIGGDNYQFVDLNKHPFIRFDNNLIDSINTIYSKLFEITINSKNELTKNNELLEQIQEKLNTIPNFTKTNSKFKEIFNNLNTLKTKISNFSQEFWWLTDKEGVSKPEVTFINKEDGSNNYNAKEMLKFAREFDKNYQLLQAFNDNFLTKFLEKLEQKIAANTENDNQEFYWNDVEIENYLNLAKKWFEKFDSFILDFYWTNYYKNDDYDNNLSDEDKELQDSENFVNGKKRYFYDPNISSSILLETSEIQEIAKGENFEESDIFNQNQPEYEERDGEDLESSSNNEYYRKLGFYDIDNRIKFSEFSSSLDVSSNFNNAWMSPLFESLNEITNNYLETKVSMISDYVDELGHLNDAQKTYVKDFFATKELDYIHNELENKLRSDDESIKNGADFVDLNKAMEELINTKNDTEINNPENDYLPEANWVLSDEKEKPETISDNSITDKNYNLDQVNKLIVLLKYQNHKKEIIENIKELTNLTQEQKNTFLEQVEAIVVDETNDQTNVENLNTILDKATEKDTEIKNNKLTFENYKSAKKEEIDTLTNLLPEDQTNFKNKIENVVYDPNKSLEENKAKIDNIVKTAKDLNDNINRYIEDFNNYKNTLITRINQLENLSDNEKNTFINQLNALNYDRTESLENNKAKLDQIFNSAQSADTEKAKKIQNVLNALNNLNQNQKTVVKENLKNQSSENLDNVENAKAPYENLNNKMGDLATKTEQLIAKDPSASILNEANWVLDKEESSKPESITAGNKQDNNYNDAQVETLINQLDYKLDQENKKVEIDALTNLTQEQKNEYKEQLGRVYHNDQTLAQNKNALEEILNNAKTKDAQIANDKNDFNAYKEAKKAEIDALNTLNQSEKNVYLEKINNLTFDPSQNLEANKAKVDNIVQEATLANTNKENKINQLIADNLNNLNNLQKAEVKDHLKSENMTNLNQDSISSYQELNKKMGQLKAKEAEVRENFADLDLLDEAAWVLDKENSSKPESITAGNEQSDNNYSTDQVTNLINQLNFEENKKTKSKAINLLTNLSSEEKNHYNKLIEQASTNEEVNSIFAQAQNNDQAKGNLINAIDSDTAYQYLNEKQKEAIKEEIKNSNNIEIDNSQLPSTSSVISKAKELNNAMHSLKDLVDDKVNTSQVPYSGANLDNKNQYNDLIHAGDDLTKNTNPSDALLNNKITEPHDSANWNKTAVEQLINAIKDEQKALSYSAISNLDNLSEEEKDHFNAIVNDPSSTPEQIKAAVEKANEINQNKTNTINQIRNNLEYTNLNQAQKDAAIQAIKNSNAEVYSNASNQSLTKVLENTKALDDSMKVLNDLVTKSDTVKTSNAYINASEETQNTYNQAISAAKELQNSTNPDVSRLDGVDSQSDANWNKEAVDQLINKIKNTLRNADNDTINKLPNLTDAEKEAFINEINNSENITPEETQAIVNKANALNNKKQTAIDKINNYPNLSDEEKAKLTKEIQDVDYSANTSDATKDGELENIVNDAKRINDVKQAKIDAINTNYEHLNDSQKAQVKKEIIASNLESISDANNELTTAAEERANALNNSMKALKDALRDSKVVQNQDDFINSTNETLKDKIQRATTAGDKLVVNTNPTADDLANLDHATVQNDENWNKEAVDNLTNDLKTLIKDFKNEVIDNLPNLSQAEKDAFKDQINKATSQEEIDSIVAKAKADNTAKGNIIKQIEDLSNLNKAQKANLINQVKNSNLNSLDNSNNQLTRDVLANANELNNVMGQIKDKSAQLSPSPSTATILNETNWVLDKENSSKPDSITAGDKEDNDYNLNEANVLLKALTKARYVQAIDQLEWLNKAEKDQAKAELDAENADYDGVLAKAQAKDSKKAQSYNDQIVPNLDFLNQPQKANLKDIFKAATLDETFDSNSVDNTRTSGVINNVSAIANLMEQIEEIYQIDKDQTLETLKAKKPSINEEKLNEYLDNLIIAGKVLEFEPNDPEIDINYSKEELEDLFRKLILISGFDDSKFPYLSSNEKKELNDTYFSDQTTDDQKIAVLNKYIDVNQKKAQKIATLKNIELLNKKQQEAFEKDLINHDLEENDSIINEAREVGTLMKQVNELVENNSFDNLSILPEANWLVDQTTIKPSNLVVGEKEDNNYNKDQVEQVLNSLLNQINLAKLDTLSYLSEEEKTNFRNQLQSPASQNQKNNEQILTKATDLNAFKGNLINNYKENDFTHLNREQLTHFEKDAINSSLNSDKEFEPTLIEKYKTLDTSMSELVPLYENYLPKNINDLFKDNLEDLTNFEQAMREASYILEKDPYQNQSKPSDFNIDYDNEKVQDVIQRLKMSLAHNEKIQQQNSLNADIEDLEKRINSLLNRTNLDQETINKYKDYLTQIKTAQSNGDIETQRTLVDETKASLDQAEELDQLLTNLTLDLETFKNSNANAEESQKNKVNLVSEIQKVKNYVNNLNEKIKNDLNSELVKEEKTSNLAQSYIDIVDAILNKNNEKYNDAMKILIDNELNLNSLLTQLNNQINENAYFDSFNDKGQTKLTKSDFQNVDFSLLPNVINTALNLNEKTSKFWTPVILMIAGVITSFLAFLIAKKRKKINN
ncbi:hypothetical protein MCSF7_01151 [Mycoplasmopsis columbina SF7]|uniref:Extracellular matrix-binding protein ebh GA module domain-containing protein n=1 Tax=Mycoplasmopsis columbina SF7 TaxID=1037410 RepID=F9UK19_9BACT|nr:GA module-containing protein [Mycoplasmopsis columbina]EGV00024.1 hypothetical protein MCSF7_01151 [Mycoplasmopsis columbina SF7]